MYKEKIWELYFGVTWHSQIYFWPLSKEGFIVPKRVFCFPLALCKCHIRTFTVRIRDGGEWSQRIYRRIVDKTSLCCCFQDRMRGLTSPQVASLWPLPGGEGNACGMGTQINNSFSVCHNTARTWPAAYQGSGRNVGGKTWNRESSSRNTNHDLLQHHSSLAEGKPEAGTASVPSSHTQPLCNDSSRPGTGEEECGKVQKWGISKA